MDSLPTTQQLKQWIKSLETEKTKIERQIDAYAAALAVHGESSKPKKRNRPKNQETIELENNVISVFKKFDKDSMKLIDVVRAIIEMSPEDTKPSEEAISVKFNNLKKSGFLTKGDKYGLWRLGNNK